MRTPRDLQSRGGEAGEECHEEEEDDGRGEKAAAVHR